MMETWPLISMVKILIVNGGAQGPLWGSSGVSIELVPSVYLSSELIVIDTQTVDGTSVL